MKTLLLITNHNRDYSEIIEKFSNNYKIIWLQLWPSMNNSSKFCQMTTSLDFLENNDFEDIGKNVRHLTKNWWQLLGIRGNEPCIDGLTVSTIFAYEIERSITPLLFGTKITLKAIKKLKPDKICFVDETKYPHPAFDILTNLSGFNLYSIFKNNNRVNEKCLFEEVPQKNENKIKQNKTAFIKKIGLYNTIINKLKKIFPPSGAIIISNSIRCNEKFHEIIKRKSSVVILDSNAYNNMESLNNNVWDTQTLNDIIFEDVSITPLFLALLPNIENQFYRLSCYYKKVTRYASKFSPKMYITVEISRARELIKAWGFYKKGIRTICTAEGLGNYNMSIYPYLENFLRPEIKMERWITSQFNTKYFSKYNIPYIITGFLSKNINTQPIDSNYSSKKKVLFALSMAHPYLSGLTFGENIFEMLKCISDLSAVFSHLPHIELTIKLHPGDQDNLNFYRNICEKNNNITFSIDTNINNLINSSDIIIVYDTSVAIEALMKQKHVIVYNYTGRKNYLSNLDSYINNNPQKGTALIYSYTKKELEQSILKAIKYPNPTIADDNLKQIIENRSPNYDLCQIINSTIKI